MANLRFNRKSQPVMADYRDDAKLRKIVNRVAELEAAVPGLNAQARDLRLPLEAADAVLDQIERRVIAGHAGNNDLAAAQDTRNEARRQLALAEIAAEEASAELAKLQADLPPVRQKAKAVACRALRAEYRVRLYAVRDALMAAVQADAALSDLIASVSAQFPGGDRGGVDVDGYARGLGMIASLRGARFVHGHGQEEFTIESETAMFLNDIDRAIAALDRQEQEDPR